MSTPKTIIPVRLALEMCGDQTIELPVWNKFLEMVGTGEIEIVGNDEFRAIEAAHAAKEKVPDARPY